MRRPASFIFLLVSATAFSQSPGQSQPVRVPSALPAAGTSQAVADPVAAAEAAIAKSDWKSADAGLDSWLVAHPADARALFDAGYVADAQNRLDDAATLYRRAIDANPQSFEAHVSLGLLLARQGKPADARPELFAATSLNPGEAGPNAMAQAWRALARIDRVSDPAQASIDLLQALKLSPETPADTLLAANLAESAGQYDDAQAAYRRLLAADPKSVFANAGLAHLLIRQKQYPEAESLLRAALQQSPDDPTLNAQMATVLAAQDKAEALPLLQKLHDTHPADPAISLMLAEVLSEAGDVAGSDRLYVTLLAASPEDADLLISHGQNLIRLLRYPEAYQVFDKATKLDAGDPDGWSGLAFAASKINQPAMALHALTMRSTFLPEVASTYFLWATSYDALHQKAAAITYYHHFLDAAAGKFPNQEWQARQRLLLLEKK